MTVAAGLVGFGYAGRVLHAPLLLASGMEIVGVVSRQEAVVRGALPATRVCADLAALLALPRLDLVVIATPNDLHEAQAIAALAAGKHVVVDKPMALSVAGADRMMQAARDARRWLVPFHNRRWDGDFLTARRIIEAGECGPIHTFEAYWDRYRPVVPDRWREHEAQGGGLLWDLGTHLVDQALELFGSPEWLQADVYCQRAGAAVDDAFELRMGKGRARIVLGASALAAQPRPRFRVSGDLGCYFREGIDPQEDQLRSGLTPSAAAFGIAASGTDGSLKTGSEPEARIVPTERGRWRDFYDGIRRSIETDSAPPVLPQQARQVLQIIEAARRSSQGGTRLELAAGHD
jgi:scyllo-inositol 2-dehydrogenase (NADP+)